MTLDKLKDQFLTQSEDDSFGLWEIVSVLKEELHCQKYDELRECTMGVVRFLIEKGVLAGDSPYVSGEFRPWPDQNLGEMVSRIEMEWRMLGHDPNIPDIVWFKKENSVTDKCQSRNSEDKRTRGRRD